MFKKLLITTVLGVTLILNAEAAATENVRRTATKCEQGSHDSINYIKRHYKNCTQCREEVIPAGKCAKVKGKHKHYYCMCDSCDSGKGVSPSKAEAQKAQTTTTKNEVIAVQAEARREQAEVTSAKQSTSKVQKVQATTTKNEVIAVQAGARKAQVITTKDEVIGVKGKQKQVQMTPTIGVKVKPTPNEQKASKAEAQKTEVAVAIKAEKVATKSSGSCKKQGSHTSIDWIKKRHKNCGNCGTQKGSKGETVYYCYCGDGCKNSSSSDLVAVPKKSLNLLKGSGEIVPKK